MWRAVDDRVDCAQQCAPGLVVEHDHHAGAREIVWIQLVLAPVQQREGKALQNTAEHKAILELIRFDVLKHRIETSLNTVCTRQDVSLLLFIHVRIMMQGGIMMHDVITRDGGRDEDQDDTINMFNPAGETDLHTVSKSAGIYN